MLIQDMGTEGSGRCNILDRGLFACITSHWNGTDIAYLIVALFNRDRNALPAVDFTKQQSLENLREGSPWQFGRRLCDKISFLP